MQEINSKVRKSHTEACKNFLYNSPTQDEKWPMCSINTDGEILLKSLRLKVGEVSGTCLICHQQKSDEFVKVGKGGTWARAQTSGLLYSTPKGLHTTALWSWFCICLLSTVWLFLGRTEVFPFWNSPIFITPKKKKIIWFCVPNLENYYLLLSDREFHFIGTIIKEFCKNPATCSETPGKKEITKRILKFKSAKLAGILELSWPKVLPLALMTRSNDSRTCWLSAYELVRGRPMYYFQF